MISLQEIKEKDLSLIAQWKKNKLITSYVDTEPIITLQEQLNWFKKISSDETCRYWIINNYGIKIGIIKLNNIDYKNKICTLEYYIGDLHFRGRKITPILIYNIYEYIFEYMKFKEIRCNIKASNKRAIYLSKNMGCTMDEKLKKDIDNVFLFINNETWSKIKNNYDYRKIIIE